MSRHDGRNADQLRSVSIEKDYLLHAEGSAIITCGNTKVLCAASVEDSIPGFKKGTGEGWLSAEYSLLPRSTHVRSFRERNKVGGRTQEIQRIIGRVLRSTLDFSKLGERTIWLDCDVLQADGGTRTAAITGAYVAMELAINKLIADGYMKESPIISQVAAISVGILDGVPLLDLDYTEDFAAEVDMNIAMTSDKEFVELQGTAEERPYSRDALNDLLDLAEIGIEELLDIQRAVIEA